jgi:hypothetical protein
LPGIRKLDIMDTFNGDNVVKPCPPERGNFFDLFLDTARAEPVAIERTGER